MEKNITIVTGQSGVSVKECIHKLGYEDYSLERYITKLSGRPFDIFIQLPQALQYEYWEKAFNEIMKEINFSKQNILTFHAAYYHQAKREHFSPVDVKSIMKSLSNKVKMIIVLIDDIYDVYLRLLKKDRMFEHVLSDKNITPLEAIYISIFYIITLLHWREIEISVSRILAELLEVNMFIVSTKHQSSMLKRLFEKSLNELNIYYISHPISEVRRISQTVLGSFVGELRLLCNEVIKASNNVLFYPTSVDEKIIKKIRHKKQDYYYPELAQRWEFPCDRHELLCPALDDSVASINPLNPRGYSVRKKDYEPISRCLELLDNFIHQRQIISRDYSLVEQCRSGVIAIRPFYEGERSDGMMGEIEHNFTLTKNNLPRKTHIFSCIEDMDKFKIEKLLTSNILKKGTKEFQETKRKWIERGVILRHSNKTDIIHDIEKKILNAEFDYEKIIPIDGWKGDAQTRKRLAREEFYDRIFNGLNKDEIISTMKKHSTPRDKVIYRLYKEKDFVGKVEEFIKKYILI